ncbi:hypothetical protein LZZ85_13805 [Terrimonas sp. NA20]|uniref:VWFD domain-containing protein n=1 Tax=Terrimonas ginsenosidimutans TaxID=2908004 RepID=A0ABS9KSU5_9BACT|nr:hypothetical protein [Terrimonas ginsenosidimutans]MCG2615370.1 hypothetical protein [Terrimonas ginsenosidimutans]
MTRFKISPYSRSTGSRRALSTTLMMSKTWCGFFLLMILLFSSCKKDKEAAERKNECGLVVDPKGKLNFDAAEGVYNYRTSGGGQILIKLNAHIKIFHESYPTFKLEFWGLVSQSGQTGILSGNHENLNGKHIKDRHGVRRTIIFPDGAKMTIVTAGEYEQILSVSIYEAGEAHRIAGPCNTVTISTTNAAEAKKMDDEEADGEAGSIELTPTGLIFWNNYTEPTPGNRTEQKVKLAEILRDRPDLVNDYYDDPRLGHT